MPRATINRPVDSTPELGRLLVIVGAIVACAGLLLLAAPRLPFRLGHLPGDIAYRGKNGSFYFPIATCILLSVILSAILWVVNHLRR